MRLCDAGTAGTCKPIDADFLVNLEHGTFEVTVRPPLTQKQKIRVELSVAGTTMSSDLVTVADKPEDTKLTLLNVEALYGASKVVVVFEPVAKAVGQPKVQLKFDNIFDFLAEIKEADLKAGRAEVALPTPLLGNGELNAKAIPGDSSKSVAPIAASIQLSQRPLRDGDRVISGSTHSSVERICVAVVGAGFDSDDFARTRSKGAGLYPCDSQRRAEQRIQVTSLRMQTAAPVVNKVRKAATETPAKTLGELFAVEERSNLSLGNDMLALTAKEAGQFLSLDRRAAYDIISEVSGPLLEEKEAAIDKSTGQFEIKLDRPLAAGSKIFVRQIFPNALGGKQVSQVGPDVVEVEPSGLDIGRARMFLTVGATVSQSNESFGKADPYVAFTGDGTFFNHLVAKQGADSVQSGRDGAATVTSMFDSKKWGVSLHWTAGLRLTQTGQLTGAGASPTLQAAQSGVFYAGLYLPTRINGMDWTYKGGQYSAFFAPLVKAGVTTVRDGIALQKVTTKTETSIDPCPVQDCSAFKKTDTPDPKITRVAGPAPFAGYGFRVGVMKYDLIGRTLRNRQISPDPVIYLDLLWGQNQAYVTPGQTTSKVTTSTDRGILTKTTTDVMGFTYETRLAVETRIKIPYMPAELGVDINNNWRKPLRSTISGDKINFTDFRVILGFRVDLAKTLSSIVDKK